MWGGLLGTPLLIHPFANQSFRKPTPKIMNYSTSKKHVALVLAAMAALGASTQAFGQTAPNAATSQAATVAALNGLSIGSLPAGIQTAVTNLNGYLATEQGINTGLVAASTTAQAAVTAQDTAIVNQTTLINGLITANPLNPAIVVQQANLATMQANLVTVNTNLANAQSAVTNSDIKIALYQQAISGPVTAAKAAAAAAATAVTNARTQFAAAGNPAAAGYNATGTTGLQSVVDTISGVSAGDQAPVVTAITAADTTFSGIGAANATVANIQALVGTINTQLPTLPAISAADKTTALNTVLNGAYERSAINTVTTNGVAETAARTAADATLTTNLATESTTRAAADATLTTNLATEVATRTALIRQEADGIHIGPNSLITNEVGGQQLLFAENAAGAAININVTNGTDLLVNGVSVATDADVAAEAATRLAADTTLQTNINTEVAARTAADTALDTRITTVNTRVTTEVGRLDGRIDTLTGRVGNVERDVRGLRRGIAMSSALQTPIIEAGKKNAVKLGAATYDGEEGLGFGYARRISESVQVNVDIATGFPETVARGGVNFSF